MFRHQPIADIQAAIGVRPIIETTGTYQFVLSWQGDSPPDAPVLFQQRVIPAHLLVRCFEAVVRHAVMGNYLRIGKPSKNRLDVIAMNPPQPAVGQEELGKLDSKVHHIQDHQFHDANWNEGYMQCIVFIAYCMSCTLLCAVSISIVRL